MGGGFLLGSQREGSNNSHNSHNSPTISVTSPPARINFNHNRAVPRQSLPTLIFNTHLTNFNTSSKRCALPDKVKPPARLECDDAEAK